MWFNHANGRDQSARKGDPEMKNAYRFLIGFLAVLLVALHIPLAADAFEGKLRMRSVTADQSALASIAGGTEAGKVLALSPKKITAASVLSLPVPAVVGMTTNGFNGSVNVPAPE